MGRGEGMRGKGGEGGRGSRDSQEFLLKLLRQLRGGVNQLLLCLNNFKSINTFLIFLQVIINIIQHIYYKIMSISHT
jgi:hypothetical protein